MAEEIHNTYRVSVDRNQSGKYEVRIQARYAGRRWTLGVYFQASSPERVFNRLAAALRFLQRREEELWLWGSNPSDRGLLFEELLAEAGL
ncbi:MAG: hypothetical protein HYY26_03485, partial [Acidobacteria bacterium]|nr:hypothetical protein [Acidobacteriota bacterium]